MKLHSTELMSFEGKVKLGTLVHIKDIRQQKHFPFTAKKKKKNKQN